MAVTAIGAYAGYQFMDKANYAEVIAAKATTKTVRVPREECRDEVVILTRPTKDPHQLHPHDLSDRPRRALFAGVDRFCPTLPVR